MDLSISNDDNDDNDDDNDKRKQQLQSSARRSHLFPCILWGFEVVFCRCALETVFSGLPFFPDCFFHCAPNVSPRHGSTR